MPYPITTLTEWWYFNGILQCAGGRRFGYELVMFHVIRTKGGIRETMPFAHMQISDLDRKVSFGVQAQFKDAETHLSTADLDHRYGDAFAFRRDAARAVFLLTGKGTAARQEIPIALDLRLSQAADPFLLNRTGMMKMPEETSTYYYSITHFKTGGRLIVGDEAFTVAEQGSDSWMDHQWGDFTVENHGWEWFSIRLENGWDANIFVHHCRATRAATGGLASFRLPGGKARFIPFEKFSIKRKDRWKSPQTRRRYPMTFKLSFPGLKLSLTVTALYPEQEENGYWEGVCSVAGRFRDGTAVAGYAYMELVY